MLSNTEKTFRPFGLAGRTLALVTVLGAAGMVAAQAQTSAQTPTLNLAAPAVTTAAEPTFSSSAPANEVAVNAEHFNFVGAMNAMQYGGRSRSGRPRYRGGNTNPDGSEKYTFFAGVGLAAPVQDTHTYNTPSWAYQVGVGRNFNKHVGVQVEFDYDHFGLQGNTLANQSALYDYYTNQYNQTPAGIANPASDVTGILDGSMHVWSFSFDPTYSIYSGEGLGAYLVGGVGFYHKVTDFTVPTIGEYCDYYCYEYSANQIIDHYTSNAPGLNGGLGLTYKFSRFGNERLYAEARYVYIFNPYRPGVTSATPPAQLNAYTGANEYPQNSLRTSYFPIKFGIRF